MPDHTAKRIEMLGLLQELKRPDEKPGAVINRALRCLKASDKLGSWMSAAEDDPSVCSEMKADIKAWFEAQQ